MIKPLQKILFASDLSTEMKQVFEHAAATAAYSKADIIVLHVMEETSKRSEKLVQMAFGERLYKDIKKEQKTGARNLLSGKNVDALKIHHAIAGFFQDGEKEIKLSEEISPIEKILVTDGRSIADEITSTADDEGCNLIVLGCKQQGRLSEAMGDNVTRKVLKRTSMPVYVVPLGQK